MHLKGCSFVRTNYHAKLFALILELFLKLKSILSPNGQGEYKETVKRNECYLFSGRNSFLFVHFVRYCLCESSFFLFYSLPASCFNLWSNSCLSTHLWKSKWTKTKKKPILISHTPLVTESRAQKAKTLLENKCSLLC